MTDKAKALDSIAQLAQTHDITLDEIGARLTQTSVKSKNSKWLTLLLGYLGGAFIFGGLGLLIAMEWDSLDSASRVIITYGPGLVAFILGTLTVKDQRFEKASTPLFLKSAILLPTGMFVFLREYAEGNDAQLAALLVFSILTLQFLLTFVALKRTSLLFFGYLFWNAALGILMDRANVPGEILGVTLGFSILAFAWHIDTTQHRAISPFWYFIGGIGLFWSVFDIVEGLFPFDLSYLLLAVYVMLLSVKIRSRTLLLVSTCALLGFLGYFTHEYFKDVTGWPIALILMGLFLVGTSAFAVKLGKKIRAT